MTIERRTGRLLRVWEEAQGSSLTADAAATDTVLEVDDVSPFNDDGEGGWLQVGDEVHAYTDVDDDASTITLATPLADPWTDGEDVSVWNDLYAQVDSVQRAHVVVEGNENNFDVIDAVVADSIDGLLNGDRGKPAETVVMERDGDEWEVIRVKGRPSLSRTRSFETNDAYALEADDITAGSATFPLSYRPVEESLKLWWRTVAQEPTEFSIDYAAPSVTLPLDGFEAAGDRVWVHYAHRGELTTDAVAFAESWSDYVASLNPIQWLRMNETDVSLTTTNDSSGNARHCSLEGFAANNGTVAGATADGDTAFNLAGDDDHISYNGVSTWVPKPDASWSQVVLFKTTMTGTGTLASMCPNGTTAASTTLLFHIGLSTPGVLSTRTWDSTADCASAGTVNDGSWHKGVVTYNGTTRLLSLYLDGALEDTATQNSSFDTNTRTLQWGARRIGGSSFDRLLAGTLDEGLLFDYELTAGQVANLWAAKDIA